tara:strand:+ start:83 stop:640 length:558 start_codon:yes stop_codon:yes gene_type:complete
MSTELFAPGTPEDDEKLAEAIYDSVCFIAEEKRKRGSTSVLEIRSPERACAILGMVCRAVPERTICKEMRTGFDVIRALKRRHAEIVEATRSHRSLKATKLQLKAADALEKKLDRVMDDEESLDKVSVKDLALSYGITTDKQRSIHGEGTVVSHEVKVTLEDARAAIDEAKASVAKAAGEKVIDV